MTDLKQYLLDYDLDGIPYGITVVATSWSHAERILEAIRSNGRIEGELVMEIEMDEPAGTA